jgi:SagB-type dehydrogenase family enzyme
VNIFRREVALHSGRDFTDTSIAALFHENTKLHRTITQRGAGQNDYELPELDAMALAYKRYRHRPKVVLPPTPIDDSRQTVSQTIAARRTRRAFADQELTLVEVSEILQSSYGITGSVPMPGGGVQSLRAAPSAGALYPAELYVAVRQVRGLEMGIYHYEVPDHALALLNSGDPTDQLYEVCCAQEYAREAGMTLLISAMVERTKRKYGDRGYRYVLLDIGHLGQNVYLSCTAMGLSVVTTCGFFDDEAADMLGINGVDESVFYVAFIGHPPT